MNIEFPFLPVKTPDPDERAFVTTHDAVGPRLVDPSVSGDNGWPLSEVTLYKNWCLRLPPKVDASDDTKLWGNYVYSGTVGSAPGTVAFMWGKNKTAAEKIVPYKTWQEMGNHYWHPILLQVKFFRDFTFPLSTQGSDGGIIVAPRLYSRVIYIPSVSEGTLFKHELYFSATKFDIAASEAPVPSSVSWDYHGSRGSFQECLHPKLIFPPMRSGYASYTTGGGTVAVGGSAANGQVFPATNFETWQPYVLSDKQQEVEAGWVRHRTTVFPPSIPEVILR